MYMIPIVLVFTIFLARMSTTYDSSNKREKYITIKNNTLAKILIERESFSNGGKTHLKKDQNKMSVVGLAFYLCNLFIIILTFILLILPPIPCMPFEIDATKVYLYADTLNQKIPIIFTMVLLCVEFLYFAIILIRYIKKVEQKWGKTLIIICLTILFLSCATVIVEMLFELFKL